MRSACRLRPDRVAHEARWCTVRAIDREGATLGDWHLEGSGKPGFDAVDSVSRLVLRAKAMGGSVVLNVVSPLLMELLELAGLATEVDDLRIQMQGQTELSEEPAGVEEGEEEVHPGDLPP